MYVALRNNLISFSCVFFPPLIAFVSIIGTHKQLESNITELETSKTKLEVARADMKTLLIMLQVCVSLVDVRLPTHNNHSSITQKKIEEIRDIDDETDTTQDVNNYPTQTPSSVQKLRTQAMKCKGQLSAIKKKLDFQEKELSSKV